MKMCPFKQTAVQAQFEYWHGYARDKLTADDAMAAAKAEFGQCDGYGCQMWRYEVPVCGAVIEWCGLQNLGTEEKRDDRS